MKSIKKVVAVLLAVAMMGSLSLACHAATYDEDTDVNSNVVADSGDETDGVESSTNDTTTENTDDLTPAGVSDGDSQSSFPGGLDDDGKGEAIADNNEVMSDGTLVTGMPVASEGSVMDIPDGMARVIISLDNAGASKSIDIMAENVDTGEQVVFIFDKESEYTTTVDIPAGTYKYTTANSDVQRIKVTVDGQFKVLPGKVDAFNVTVTEKYMPISFLEMLQNNILAISLLIICGLFLYIRKKMRDKAKDKA